MNIKHRIDEILNGINRKNSPGCAVGILKDGKIIYENFFGMANLEHSIEVNEKTVFNVGSISKQFTATCIALLEDEKKINIEDSIKKHIQELPDYCEDIKIKDLVFMTNGIRDFYHTAQFLMGLDEDDSINEGEALKLISSMEEPIFKVGEKWSYGNSGYFLLGIIIKRITGKSLAKFAKEMIFTPLGMRNTFFRESVRTIIKNRAQGYCKFGELNYKEKNFDKNEICKSEDNYELQGAGQVWTTLEDLIIWDSNFYNNKLGENTEKFIEKLIIPGKTSKGDDCPYGYGLFLEDRKGKRHIYHGGSTAGFIAMINRIPEEKTTVIYLSNSSYEYFDLMEELEMSIDKYLLDAVTDNLCEEKATDVENNQGEKNNIEKLEKFFGRFQCGGTSSVIEIKNHNGNLVLIENRESKTVLKYKSENVFCSDGGDCEYRFLHDMSKRKLEIVCENSIKEFEEFVHGVDENKLEDYIGEYYCNQLDTTFIVTIDDKKLYMINKNRGRKGIDFHYEPSLEDNFINFNGYSGTMYISFERDHKECVSGFFFRDYNGDNREALIFKKLSKGRCRN